jgi:Asp-tRNA(Asn)/Glu-tRNA(Gln) amidotransferase A subunit family amidase
VERGELPGLGIEALGDLLRRGETSSEAIVTACLERIERLDPALRAFITVDAEGARRAARRLDRGRARGPLAGIPFAVKDALWARGLPATNGSRLFADFRPAEDATVVARLRAAGAVLVGKLNMMELGFGPTARPPFGTPRNPWNRERTPGGSSSGSASAVAARLVPFTIGGDTGGSIRLPAALCGVVGLKPSRGRVSRHGLMGICPAFDTAGPLAARVADVARVLAVMAGRDRRDAGTSRAPVDDYLAACAPGIAGTRVAVVKEFMESPVLAAEVRGLIMESVGALEQAGARVSQVSIPLLAHASAIYVGIAEPAAAALYRSLLAARGAEIDVLPRRRLLTASLLPASVIATAHRLAERLRAEVDTALGDVDVLAGPTTPTAAPPLPAPSALRSAEEAWLVAVGGRSLFTNPFNITGHPALSVPCGFTGERLPVGLQIVGRHGGDADVLRVGAGYEAVTDWHRRRPPLD